MPPRGKNLRSRVWKYFVFSPNNDSKSKCKACGGFVSHRSNTTNLKNHLQRNHPELYKQSFATVDKNSSNSEIDVAAEEYEIDSPESPVEVSSIANDNNSISTTLQSSISSDQGGAVRKVALRQQNLPQCISSYQSFAGSFFIS